MESEYYSLVAQVIPVLFLAVTLQSVGVFGKLKYTTEHEKSLTVGLHIICVIGISVILAYGEFVALNAIYTSTFTGPALHSTIVALVLGASFVALDVVLKIADKSEFFTAGATAVIGVGLVAMFALGIA